MHIRRDVYIPASKSLAFHADGCEVMATSLMAASLMATSRSLLQSGRLVVVVVILLATTALPASARPYKLGDEATARCKNLLPQSTRVVMNGVFVASSGVATVAVSRREPTVTVQVVVAGKLPTESLQSKYSVPIAAKLVNAPRILFALELRSGDSCGCGAGELCLKTPSLLGYFGFQRCAAPIEESVLDDDVISVARSPFPEPDYPSHIQMVDSAGGETRSWSVRW